MGVYDFDVIVIGGGPGGAAAATFLRKNDLRVCVVEKERFPRFHIGESMLPQGNHLLKEMGVWPSVEKFGFIPKYGAYFHTANGSATREVIFSEGIIRGLDSTFQVERAKLDQLLLKNAQSLGAEVEVGTTVRAVIPSNNGFLITLAAQGQPDRRVSAQWIVDASGRDQLFPSELKRALEPATQTKRVAIYSHFRNVGRAPGKAAGHTIVVRLVDGWFWIIPIDEERTSVGLVTPTMNLRDSELEPTEFFHRTVAESPKLRELMANSELTMPFHVTSDYSYFRRDLASDRMLLVGDAAGFLDPIFSSGVYAALFSGKLAAQAIVKAHRKDRSLSQREQNRYTSTVKGHAVVFQKLIDAFYDNESFSVFMCPKPPLRLDRGINSIAAGRAALSWSLWWRFKAFLLVCQMQERFSLVPRVDLSNNELAAAEQDPASDSVSTTAAHP